MASIRKHGSNWQARVKRKGYPVETRTFPTKTEARNWSRSIENDFDKGIFHSRSEAEQITLANVINRYIAEVSMTKRGGREEVIRLGAMKRNRIASYSMANLTPQVVAQYRDERLKNCKAGTVIRDLAMLSSLINHSRREWQISMDNPISRIRRPAMPLGRVRVLSLEEEKRLISALQPQGRRNPFMLPMAIIALETAMRRGELLSLRWKDINLDTRVAYLATTKNGESRAVPLSTTAVGVLRSLNRTTDDRVFPINAAAMEACFRKAKARAELYDFHFHDLRHMAITRLGKV